MRLSWSHIVMYVRNFDAMIDFYTKLLGFEVADRGPLFPGKDDPQICFLSQSGSDHHQVAFVPFRQGDDPPNSVDHVAFRVEGLGDVKEMARRIEADGRATQINGVCHGNAWSVYFRDPEGNGIEVFCDTPWHVKQPQLRPFDLDMSEQDALEWTRKEFGGEPSFGPIEDYYAARRKHLAKR